MVNQEKTMNNLGGNDPCWCQSGKKYKKCHLNRDRQQKDNPWRAVGANKKAFNKKKCCAQGGMLGACGGNVIRAHTVSHGPNLSKISRNGKVIQYCVNKNGGKLVASEIGTRNASVFYGFCAQHDQALFSCIENKDFVGRPNQCLAVAYRTLSRELYGKDASGHLRETLRGADKGKSLFEQVFVQKMLDVVDCGNEASRKELKVTHDKLTQALADGRADVLRSLVIEFDGELPFMLAGAWSPLTDFFGNELQSGYADQLLDQIFLSSFAGAGTSYLCISWMDDESAPGQVIANQISGLAKGKQAKACLQYAVKHIENVFYSPDWFDALISDQRKQLNALAASGLDSLGSIPDAAIRLDLDFALPCAAHVFYSNGTSG